MFFFNCFRCTLLFLLIHLSLAVTAQSQYRSDSNLNTPRQQHSEHRYRTHRYVRRHSDDIRDVPEALESSHGKDIQRSRTSDDSTVVDTNSNGRRSDMERIDYTQGADTNFNSHGEIISGNRPLHISIPLESETRNSIVQIPDVEDGHKTGSVESSYIGKIANETINKHRIVENGLLRNSIEKPHVNQTNDKTNNLESPKVYPTIEDRSEESQAREMDKIVKHYEKLMLTERQFEEENDSPLEDNHFEDIASNVQARVKRYDNAENFAEAMSLINSLPLIDIASMVGQTDDSFETSTPGGEEKALPNEESATNKDAEFRTVITFEEKVGLENIENGTTNTSDEQFSRKTGDESPVTNDPISSTEITISVVENRELEKDITTTKIELTENLGFLNVTNEFSTEKEPIHSPSESLKKEAVDENFNLEELRKDESVIIPEINQFETATQAITSLNNKSIPSVHAETSNTTESLKSVTDVLTTERLPKVATEVSMMKSVSMSISVGGKGESPKQVNTSDIGQIIERSEESSTRNISNPDERFSKSFTETNIIDYTSTVGTTIVNETKEAAQEDKLIPDEHLIKSELNKKEQIITDETSTYIKEGSQLGRNNSELTLESSKNSAEKITENITNENQLKPLALEGIENKKTNDVTGAAESVKVDGKIKDETAQELLRQFEIIDSRSETESTNSSLTINDSVQTNRNDTKIAEVTTVKSHMNNEALQELSIKKVDDISITVENTSLTTDSTDQIKKIDRENIEALEGTTPNASNTLVTSETRHNDDRTDGNINDTLKLEKINEPGSDIKDPLSIFENSTEVNVREKLGTQHNSSNSTESTTETLFFVYKTITGVIELENNYTTTEVIEPENNSNTIDVNSNLKYPSNTTQDESTEDGTQKLNVSLIDNILKNNTVKVNTQLDNSTSSEDINQNQNTTEAPKENVIEKENQKLDKTPTLDLNTTNNTSENHTNTESKQENSNNNVGKQINNNTLNIIEETNQNKMKEINKFNLRPRPKYQSPIYKKKQLSQLASSGAKPLESSTKDEIQAHQKMVNSRRIIMDEMNSQVVQGEVQLLLSKDEHRFSPSAKIKNRSQKPEGRESFKERFGSRPIAGLQNKSKSIKNEEILENNEKTETSNYDSNGENIDELVDQEGSDVTAPTLSENDTDLRADNDGITTELSTRERLIQIRKEKIKNSYIKSIQNYRNNEKVKNLKSDELKNRISAMIEQNLEEQLTSNKKFTNIQKLNESDEDGAVRQRVIYTPIRTPKPGFRIPVDKLFTDDSPSNIGARKKYTRTNFRENKSDATVAKKDSEDNRGSDQPTTETKPQRTFNRKPTPKYIFSNLMTEKPPQARPQFKPSTSKTRKTTTTSTTTENLLDFQPDNEEEWDITPPPTTPESFQTRPPTTTKPKPSIENLQNRLVKVEPNRKTNKGNVPFRNQPITTRSNSPNRFSILKKVTSPPTAIQTTRAQPEFEDESSEELVTTVPSEKDEFVPVTTDTIDSSSEAPVQNIRDQRVNKQKGEAKDIMNIRPVPKRIIKQRYNVGSQNLHPRLLRAMQLRNR